MIRVWASVYTAAVAALLLGGCSVGLESVSSYSSVDGRFVVTVPGGKMTETSLTGGGPFAGGGVHAFVASTQQGARLAVLYSDAAATYIAGTPVDRRYADAEQGNLISTRGTQTSEGPVTIAGMQGREQRITRADMSYVFRLLWVGNRMYAVSVSGSTAQVNDAESQLFLNSLALVS